MLFFHKMNRNLSSLYLPALLIMGLTSGAFPSGATTLEGVTLSSSGHTKEGQPLQFVGAGLRSKKVLMVPVKVYVGELLATTPAQLKKTDPLATLTAAAPVMMRLHFLREVEGEKVQSSFKEALIANKVDLQKPEIQKFLNAVRSGGEVKKSGILSIYGAKKADGTEVIIYEDANAKATPIEGGAGFLKEIFAIWLGTPSDEGVAKLKTELLK